MPIIRQHIIDSLTLPWIRKTGVVLIWFLTLMLITSSYLVKLIIITGSAVSVIALVLSFSRPALTVEAQK
jgi:hypothetical protein